MEKQYCVYILSNKKYGTIYTGITSDLSKRIWDHKNKNLAGFSKKYSLGKLVYYEIYRDIEQAIKQEKQLKDWKRKWKCDLVDNSNPEWKDLYLEL